MALPESNHLLGFDVLLGNEIDQYVYDNGDPTRFFAILKDSLNSINPGRDPRIEYFVGVLHVRDSINGEFLTKTFHTSWQTEAEAFRAHLRQELPRNTVRVIELRSSSNSPMVLNFLGQTVLALGCNVNFVAAHLKACDILMDPAMRSYVTPSNTLPSSLDYLQICRRSVQFTDTVVTQTIVQVFNRTHIISLRYDRYQQPREDTGDGFQYMSFDDIDWQAGIQQYCTIESINEAKKSIDAANSVRKVTLVAFIFIPLSFVTSFFGMNVDILGTGDVPIRYFFIVAIVTTIFAYVLTLMVPRAELLWMIFKGDIQDARQLARKDKHATTLVVWWDLILARTRYDRLLDDLIDANPSKYLHTPYNGELHGPSLLDVILFAIKRFGKRKLRMLSLWTSAKDEEANDMTASPEVQEDSVSMRSNPSRT
ncbi:MAG: hypothetical protein M1828_004772 [Chrysothrix sp. TS-e1954]|nr:MAG: hypothetical protein M1828_004772 [Chrysothrix sp. TS-e1954]